MHATAYPLGSVYHIPHGQSNQLMFRSVMEKYKEIKPVGRINELEAVIAEALGLEEEWRDRCSNDRESSGSSHMQPLDALYELMDEVLKAQPLREFGVKEEDLPVFANSVINTQLRLLKNNYVELTEEQVLEIYKATY